MPLRADVKNVFHNAETGMFEADVTLHDAGVRHSYPVSILAPITAEFETLRPAMIRAAELLHVNQAGDLKSHVLPEAQANRTEELLDRILFAGPRYLDEILARAA